MSERRVNGVIYKGNIYHYSEEEVKRLLDFKKEIDLYESQEKDKAQAVKKALVKRRLQKALAKANYT